MSKLATFKNRRPDGDRLYFTPCRHPETDDGLAIMGQVYHADEQTTSDDPLISFRYWAHLMKEDAEARVIMARVLREALLNIVHQRRDRGRRGRGQKDKPMYFSTEIINGGEADNTEFFFHVAPLYDDENDIPELDFSIADDFFRDINDSNNQLRINQFGYLTITEEDLHQYMERQPSDGEEVPYLNGWVQSSAGQVGQRNIEMVVRNETSIFGGINMTQALEDDDEEWVKSVGDFFYGIAVSLLERFEKNERFCFMLCSDYMQYLEQNNPFFRRAHIAIISWSIPDNTNIGRPEGRWRRLETDDDDDDDQSLERESDSKSTTSSELSDTEQSSNQGGSDVCLRKRKLMGNKNSDRSDVHLRKRNKNSDNRRKHPLEDEDGSSTSSSTPGQGRNENQVSQISAAGNNGDGDDDDDFGGGNHFDDDMCGSSDDVQSDVDDRHDESSTQGSRTGADTGGHASNTGIGSPTTLNQVTPDGTRTQYTSDNDDDDSSYDGPWNDEDDEEGEDEDEDHDDARNNDDDNSTPVIRVAKYFDGELYFGRVDHQHVGKHRETLWHIIYDDKDEEDFSDNELGDSIRLYQQEEKNESHQRHSQDSDGDDEDDDDVDNSRITEENLEDTDDEDDGAEDCRHDASKSKVVNQPKGSGQSKRITSQSQRDAKKTAQRNRTCAQKKGKPKLKARRNIRRDRQGGIRTKWIVLTVNIPPPDLKKIDINSLRPFTYATLAKLKRDKITIDDHITKLTDKGELGEEERGKLSELETRMKHIELQLTESASIKQEDVRLKDMRSVVATMIFIITSGNEPLRALRDSIAFRFNENSDLEFEKKLKKWARLVQFVLYCVELLASGHGYDWEVPRRHRVVIAQNKLDELDKRLTRFHYRPVYGPRVETYHTMCRPVIDNDGVWMKDNDGRPKVTINPDPAVYGDDPTVYSPDFPEIYQTQDKVTQPNRDQQKVGQQQEIDDPETVDPRGINTASSLKKAVLEVCTALNFTTGHGVPQEVIDTMLTRSYFCSGRLLDWLKKDKEPKDFDQFLEKKTDGARENYLAILKLKTIVASAINKEHYWFMESKYASCTNSQDATCFWSILRPKPRRRKRKISSKTSTATVAQRRVQSQRQCQGQKE